MNPDAAPAPAFVSLSPVLVVDAIEPCLPLWEEKLGFERVAEVPHSDGEGLGFVMLQKDGVTVMYQTRASVREDVPAIEEETSRGATSLFLTVADLDAVEPLLEGEDVFLPRRTTFYGAEEIGVRGAGGHFFTFAEFAEEEEAVEEG